MLDWRYKEVVKEWAARQQGLEVGRNFCFPLFPSDKQGTTKIQRFPLNPNETKQQSENEQTTEKNEQNTPTIVSNKL